MCPYCYKVYMQYQGFVSHMKKHQCETEATCDQCGKVFSSKRMLESHMLLHTDKRPFQCPHCDKSFRQQSALYVHGRCHLPEHMKVEYSCDQCDKRYLSNNIPHYGGNRSIVNSLLYFLFQFFNQTELGDT